MRTLPNYLSDTRCPLTQTPPVAQKPHRSTTTTSKIAVPSTPTPKTIVPMPVTVEADDETEETSSLDEDFFVENVPDETLA